MAEPAAVIKMDLLQFNRLASERLSSAEAQSLLNISGDLNFARQVLAQTVIPF
jgi:hypothetical protein